MQVTVERTQPCQAKVSFTVPAQELDLEFANAPVSCLKQRLELANALVATSKRLVCSAELDQCFNSRRVEGSFVW